MQKEIKELIKKVAYKYNKPIQVIEEIYNSQFLFLKHETSKENPEEIKTTMLPNWGKYCLMEGKLYMIRKTMKELNMDPSLTSYQRRKLKKENKGNKENDTNKDGQEVNNQFDSQSKD